MYTYTLIIWPGDPSIVSELGIMQHRNLPIHTGDTFPDFFLGSTTSTSKIILCNLWDCDQFFLQPCQSHEPLFFSALSLCGIYPWPLDHWTFLKLIGHEIEGLVASNHQRRLDFHDELLFQKPLSWLWIVHPRFHGHVSPAEAFLVGKGTTLVILARKIPAFVSTVQSWSIVIARIFPFQFSILQLALVLGHTTVLQEIVELDCQGSRPPSVWEGPTEANRRLARGLVTGLPVDSSEILHHQKDGWNPSKIMYIMGWSAYQLVIRISFNHPNYIKDIWVFHPANISECWSIQLWH